MSDTLVAPENETFPNRKRWTRKECENLMKAGVLLEGYELIDGEILSRMGQKPPHSGALGIIALWLASVFGLAFIRNQMPLPLPGEAGRMNEPQPDLAVTAAPLTEYFKRDPAPSDVMLLVEVSDSTLRLDKTTKALLYAQAGVREYWVANVAKREIIRHRQPERTGYAEVVTLGADETISPEGRPEDLILVGDLFPPPAKSE